MTATATTSRPSAPASTMGLPIAGKVTIFGLALFAVAMIGILIAAPLSGDYRFFTTVFPAILLAVVVLLAGLVWRFGARALVLTAVLMLLSLAGNLPIMLEGLRFPASFFDFVPSLLALTGNLIALGGAVVALVARRRRATRSTPTRVERTAAGVFIAALVALAALSGVLTVANRESVSAEAKAGALPVRMKATKFEQERIEARAGQPVRLLVRNADPGLHSFTIDALATDVTIAPGSERVIELGPIPPGEYAYVCKLFGHEATMKGTLVVAP